MRSGQIERRPVTAGEHRLFVCGAAVPHRADRVDDVLCLQLMAVGDLGAAGGAAAERATFLQQSRPGGAMDGAVHAAAAEQRAVGGVDDRVNVERGDVGDFDLQQRRADFRGEQGH
jgi:hypothetical protein